MTEMRCEWRSQEVDQPAIYHEDVDDDATINKPDNLAFIFDWFQICGFDPRR